MYLNAGFDINSVRCLGNNKKYFQIYVWSRMNEFINCHKNGDACFQIFVTK